MRTIVKLFFLIFSFYGLLSCTYKEKCQSMREIAEDDNNIELIEKILKDRFVHGDFANGFDCSGSVIYSNKPDFFQGLGPVVKNLKYLSSLEIGFLRDRDNCVNDREIKYLYFGYKYQMILIDLGKPTKSDVLSDFSKSAKSYRIKDDLYVFCNKPRM